MAGVTYEVWTGSEAESHLDTFLPAHKEVFAEPPYCEGPKEVADFIDLFHIQAKRPGFRVAVARDGAEIAGFSFGYQLPMNSQWWSGLLEPMPEDFTRETNERTFAIIELAVRKPWRRQGIAAGLHTRILDGLPVERVTLTMLPDPEAAAAHRAYAAWGYRRIGKSRPWDEAPLYEAMVLDLR
ncbi:putative acetyltransferase [Streptomyces himastatinicus ATCC 53653]|uniref:Putative acetyltransferase n=1 Tax=Streptomyces himastatinicus ATCC 53653 TaxID=457427 RepID=D9W6B2_9ACTN|nr:GNAT family N-acetyltransferase [Streptomyces himastatinicus]EFL22443.1 putative acetyltransferase [Streptomyces himastatinicus ATCC 53653]